MNAFWSEKKIFVAVCDAFDSDLMVFRRQFGGQFDRKVHEDFRGVHKAYRFEYFFGVADRIKPGCLHPGFAIFVNTSAFYALKI